jgi:hypothetical protein
MPAVEYIAGDEFQQEIWRSESQKSDIVLCLTLDLRLHILET